ncbi:CBS domain-containing protein, partial [Acinetobacter baumannii]
ANAMKRRRNVWPNLGPIKDILESIPLSEVIDPLPGVPLQSNDSVFEAIERMNKHRLDFISVVNKDHLLIGIVTRTDLLHS